MTAPRHPVHAPTPAPPPPPPSLVVVALALLAAPTAGSGADFTIDFRAHPNNPHPPVPQCQVLEEDDPPYPDTTGDCLYGLGTSNGQPIECLEAGLERCPVLTIGVPSPNLMFVHDQGLGLLDYDVFDPDSCATNCSSGCLVGEDCGLDPDPCFCEIRCCTGTPSPSGDWKDGLDLEHQPGVPSDEEIRIRFGVPVLLSDVGFWRAAGVEMSYRRSDCPAPVILDHREGADPPTSGDGLFTFPGGGFFLPPNAALTIATASFRPFSTNDRVALAEMGVTRTGPVADQPRWRLGCPFFAVPFDNGLVDVTAEEWVVTDDDSSPTVDLFTNTLEVSTTHCGLPNSTGGAAGAVCYQSPPGRSGFDTSLVSRSFDLSAAAHPVLRFLLDFARDDELLDVSTSVDGGATWDLRASVDEGSGGGSAYLVALQELAGEPDVRLRFRYHDPAATDAGTVDHLVLDDILVYSDDLVFADGFESGDLSAW